MDAATNRPRYKLYKIPPRNIRPRRTGCKPIQDLVQYVVSTSSTMPKAVEASSNKILEKSSKTYKNVLAFRETSNTSLFKGKIHKFRSGFDQAPLICALLLVYLILSRVRISFKPMFCTPAGWT